MRAVSRRLSASVALLALIFGFATPASAANLPSDLGAKTRYILKVSDVGFSSLSNLIDSLNLNPAHEYSEVFSGFSVELTAEQKSYLQTMLPGLEVLADTPVSLTDTQSNAIWNLSDLDEAGTSLDSTYKYPDSAGSGVRAYVLDTGINPNATQFGNRLVAGYDATGGGTTLDSNGHGTHVAGTIGSVKYGVAKSVTLVPVRVLDANGDGFTSDWIAGIDWVINHNPAGTRAVINMSMGADSAISAVDAAIARAVDANIFVAGAAGNSNADACDSSPGSSTSNFTVGSIDSSHLLSDFSNYGTCVDILAPGENITSLDYSNSSGYAVHSGTSMATPHVAGAAALYLSLHPTAGVASIKTALKNGAEAGANVRGTTTTNKLLDIRFMNTKPELVSAPSVGNGTVPIIGQTLNATAATWSSSGAYDVTHQWFACAFQSFTASTTLPNGCLQIPNATSTAIVVNAGQVNQYLMLRETATGDNGATISYSATTEAVSEPPAASSLHVRENPSLSLAGGTNYGADGAPRLFGEFTTTLKALNGLWTSDSGTISFEYKWYRCSSLKASAGTTLPVGCELNAEQSQQTYTVTSVDVSKYLVAAVVARNSDGTSIIYTESSKSVTKAPEVQSATQIIANLEVKIGNQIQAALAEFSAIPEASKTFQWYACNSISLVASSTLPAGCSAITGATGSGFTPGAAQKSKYLMVATVARNDATGTASVASFSPTTSVAVAAAPTLKLSATGSGGTVKFTQSTTPALNTKLTVDVSSWMSATSFVYKWFRCGSAVETGSTEPDCEVIAGATASSYVVTASDVEKYITAFVTAKSGNQETSARLASSAMVWQVPVNTGVPVVTGSPVAVDVWLTEGDTSTWRYTAPIEYKYEWLSCTAAVVSSATKNAKCTPISGATSKTFKPSTAQNNKYLVVRVIASNQANSTAPSSYYSASSTKVLMYASNSVLPTISSSLNTASGQPIVGATLTVKAGTWLGNPAPVKTYQWFACDSAVASASEIPSDCEAIAGATANKLVTDESQKTKFITVVEKATNSIGERIVVAAASKSLLNKPIFLSSPSISGQVRNGYAIEAIANYSTIGGTPTVQYQWFTCTASKETSDLAPIGCNAIPGETQSNVALDVSHETKRILVKVTLTNDAGVTVKYSATTSQVTGPLANTRLDAPKASAELIAGTTLTVGNSTWTGFPEAETKTYKWYRCVDPVQEKSAQLPNTCAAIGTATSDSYRLTADDVKKHISVKVTYSQGLDIVSVWSPTISSELGVGQSPAFADLDIAEEDISLGNQNLYNGADLVANLGTTHGWPANTVSYRWFRCETQVLQNSSTLADGCAVISAATSSSYAFKNKDVKRYVLAEITLDNKFGNVKRYTASTIQIGSAPENETLPTPTLEPGAILKIGSTLSATEGTWTAMPDSTTTMQWVSCKYRVLEKTNNLPTDCYEIYAANQSTYEIRSDDAGRHILIAVTATNSNGSAVVYSASTNDVGQAPSFTSIPKLTSPYKKGETISSNLSAAGWPDPTPTAKYRWFRCETPVATSTTSIPLGCNVISAATGADYVIAEADVQKYLVKEITLTNRIDTVVRYTASSKQILMAPEITGNFTVTGLTYFDTPTNPKVLTANQATVKAFPVATPIYQWLRNGTIISGANLPTYTLTMADVGATISYTVTASNVAGDAASFSAESPEIGLTPRLSTVALAQKPAVCLLDSDGEIAAGSTVSACLGAWTANPEVKDTDFTLQWYLCNSQSMVQENIVPADCTKVAKATGQEFQVTDKDEGKFIGFTVTAINGTISRTYWANSSKRIYVRPFFLKNAKATIPAGEAGRDGSPRVGHLIEATLGNWRGVLTNSYSYQWFSCEKALPQTQVEPLSSKCYEIIGAETSSYVVGEEQVGRWIGVKITGTYKYNSLTDSPTSSHRSIVYTSTTTRAVIAPPKNVRAPEITSRYTYVDSTMKTTEGTWTGSPEPTITHAWYYCNEPITDTTTIAPTGCTEIPKSAGNLTVLSTYIGKYISSMAKAVNDGGEVRIWSITGDAVRAGPVNKTAPTISIQGASFPGTNTPLTVSNGTWIGQPVRTANPYSYYWYRCQELVAQASEYLDSTNCQRIDGATSATYTPARDDVGKYLVAAVQATDDDDDFWIHYTKSTEQVDLPPANLTSPTIPAIAFVGRAMSSYAGTWEGIPTPTLAYQWYVCETQKLESSTTLAADCSIIEGADKATYKPVVSQIEKYLVLKVTAKNRVGQASSFSVSSNSVVSGPVMITAAGYQYPTDFNNPVVGSRLSTTGGTWQGTPEPEKAYEWLVCDTAPTAAQISGQKDVSPPEDPNPIDPLKFLGDNKCQVIVGENTNVINPPETARGKFMMVHVIATNVHGVDDWYSAVSSVVWMSPVLDTPAKVFGKTFNRLTVKAKEDTWKAYPEPTKTYQWYLCDQQTELAGTAVPQGCAVIAGATNGNYRIPQVTDQTKPQYLAVKVIASNSAGSSAATYSGTSSAIIAGPANIEAPTITGAATFAFAKPSALETLGGTWVNVDTVRNPLTYQWYRCTKELAASDELDPSCSLIPDANGSTYTLTADDVLTPAEATEDIKGKSVLVAVRGENSLGDSVTYSKSTNFITEKVNYVSQPTITGLPRVDSEATGAEGNWRGYPKPATTYQWYYCKTLKVEKSEKQPSDCKAIGNAKTTKLTVSSAFLGFFLVFGVTKSNTVAGVTQSVKVFSPSTTAVSYSPELKSKPYLDPPGNATAADIPKVGTAWKIVATWKQKPPVEEYQWYRCLSRVDRLNAYIREVPDGCEAIEGATMADYTLRVADNGKYILAKVRGVLGEDVVESFTNSTEKPVAQPPRATTLPIVSGVREVGEALTVTEGVWDPVGTKVTYQWYSCTEPVLTETNEIPRTCQVLSKKTANSYSQSPLFDASKYITVAVIGSFGGASTPYLLPVSVKTLLPPRIVDGGQYPLLDYETFLVGDLFTITPGQWEAEPSPTFQYQWYRCQNQVLASTDVIPADCIAISDATAKTYKAVDADNGRYLAAAEIATSGQEQKTWLTASTESPVKAGLQPTSPFVSLTSSSREILTTTPVTITVANGTWSQAGAVVTPPLVHRWVYCKTKVVEPRQNLGDCQFMFDLKDGGLNQLLADEDKSSTLSLSVRTAFAGYYIAAVEYALKPNSSTASIRFEDRETTRISASTDKILMQPNLWNSDSTDELITTAYGGGYQAPRLSTNTFAVGSTDSPIAVIQYSKALSTTDPFADDAKTGPKITWRGVGASDAKTFDLYYKWYRCGTAFKEIKLAEPDGCVAISTATDARYTPTADDVGMYVSARITATNSVGSGVIWTPTTWKITQVPTVTVNPELNSIPDGSVRMSGDTVSVTSGTWTGLPEPGNVTYSWYLCPTTTITAGCLIYVNASESATSFVIPTLGGLNKTKYVVARVSRANYPHLASETTPNNLQELRSFDLVTGRIYEKPDWTRTVTTVSGPVISTVPLKTDTGPELTNIGNSASNINANVGETLVMVGMSGDSDGYWSATEAPTRYDYSWYNCSIGYRVPIKTAEVPSGCTLIDGQTTSRLTLTEAHVDGRIMGRVLATNRFGTGASWTSSTPPVTQRPVNTTPPSISLGALSEPAVGDTISGSAGAYKGQPNPGVPEATYQWYSCDSAVTASTTLSPGCNPIAGATFANYTITKDQRSKYLMFRSGGSNVVNPNATTVTTYHYSASVGSVKMDPEFELNNPNVTGQYHAGYTLTLTPISVISNPAATTTWDWYLCTTLNTRQDLTAIPNDCVKQNQENSSTFILTASMSGKYAVVFASSVSRVKPTLQNSSYGKQITVSPVNTTPPGISGTLVANGINQLTVNPGSWSANPAVGAKTYNWYLCTSATLASSTKPASCKATAEATTSNILMKREWAGKYLVVEETAYQPSNNVSPVAGLSTKYYSASSGKILSIPEFATEPSFTADSYAHLGETMVVTFTQNAAVDPADIQYKWYRCTTAVAAKVSITPDACEEIAGQSDDTFQVGQSEVAMFVTASVRIYNASGSVTRFAPTGNAKASKTPTNLSPATISGQATVGADKYLDAIAGTWSSSPTSTSSFAWYVCTSEHTSASTSLPSDCSSVGVSSARIQVASTYREKYLMVAEQASSLVNKPGAGTAKVYSATTGKITMAPAITSIPSMDGVLHDGQTIEALMPTIEAYPAATSSYRWLECTSQPTTSQAAIPSSCSEIPGTADANLVLTTSQVGKYITLIVKAQNDVGFSYRTSIGSVVVTGAPSVVTAPKVSGSKIYSSTSQATVNTGTWTGVPTPSTSTYKYTYNWYACSALTESGSALDSSCSQTSLGSSNVLTLARNMNGKYLVAKVTATAPTNMLNGTATATYSAGFGPIAVAPVFTVDPTLNNYAPSVNTILTIDSSGTWNPYSSSDTISYRWYTCTKTHVSGSITVPTDCSEITGNATAPLEVKSTMVGKYILAMVSVTNAGGTTLKATKTTNAVLKAAAITASLRRVF